MILMPVNDSSTLNMLGYRLVGAEIIHCTSTAFLLDRCGSGRLCRQGEISSDKIRQ